MKGNIVPSYRCRRLLLDSSLLAHSQTLVFITMDKHSTISSMRILQKVFPKMRAVNVSVLIKQDPSIRYLSEEYWKKHKRKQMTIVCSNKMRELARFILCYKFRKLRLMKIWQFEVLLPECFVLVWLAQRV